MTSPHYFRWRERRQTLPARRRRRRHRRREIDRPGPYVPQSVDTSSASRGVRKRLAGAVLALAVTVGCISIGVGTSMATFAGLFAITVGASSLGAAVALILSARDEERVHDLAGQLDEQGPENEESTKKGLLGDGTDGWVGDSKRAGQVDAR